jgi:aminoglycoside phosphotransferase (APT) family kinase protein
MAMQSTLTSSLRDVFERWLAERQAGAAVAAAALSADRTVLVDAGWEGETHRLVVRLASSGPFETRSHFLTLRRLGTQLTRPAVPSALWCEDDPGTLGAPFFVMTRVDGLTTARYETPYTFASWITEASGAERQRMQRATLEQLGRVHAATPSDFAFLDRRRPGESALAAHVRRIAERYQAVSARGLQAPPIERAFAWLREHWPAETAPVLCWGDARIDNVIYRDFGSATLTGWQHATLGPRELDLGALVFHHRLVDDLAHSAGHAGLPDFMRPDDVAATYADITGHRLADLDFYIVFAALQHAIETIRSPLRTKAFQALAEAMTGE